MTIIFCTATATDLEDMKTVFWVIRSKETDKPSKFYEDIKHGLNHHNGIFLNGTDVIPSFIKV
jgi:hypothetical protein